MADKWLQEIAKATVYWRPLAEFDRARPDFPTVLLYIPSDGEDFERFELAFWKRDGFRLHHDDKLIITDATHFAELHRP